MLLRNISQRLSEARNPVTEGEFGERMRRLYTVREAFSSPSEAAGAARRAKRRFGAIVSVFERAGFWRVKVAA